MIQKEKAAIEQSPDRSIQGNYSENSDKVAENPSGQDKNNIYTLPNLETTANKTDKTDKTDFSKISNTEFIDGIFGKITDSTRPVVVSFSGNPGKVRSNAWFGEPYVAGKTLFPGKQNNYTSFATYNANDDGNYRRQKKHFVALYAIMLDDVGVKVEADRITLEPSWQIETSPGNFQIGYILDEPIADPAMADNFLKSIIAAGLCDPGSNGACARIGRLPVAINGKHQNDDGSHWHCRLTHWKPENRYTMQEVVNGLQIELKETSRQRRESGRNNKSEPAPYQDEIYRPRADENPIITELKHSGRYKQPLGDGKHDITCPWVHEHTDQVDHGTAYFEPDESYPLGGFKCQHAHCTERHVSALLDCLDISRTEAKHKSIINIQAGELSRICNAAEIELAKTGSHYQRAGMIVTITTDPGTEKTTVKPLTINSLTRVIASTVIWQRYDKRGKEWHICDPVERHVRLLYDATSYPNLPVLNGIARQPYLRPDGSLVIEAGYDPDTGMFGVFNAKEYSVPDKPTKQEAEQALFELTGLLDEFAFKTEHDKAAAISGILTAGVRASLPQAPMIHVKAPSIASGKSYLCELLTAFATPQKGTPLAFPADDEECRKLLLAELLTAPAVVEFDNLTSDLMPHKSLCSTLTSEYVSGRILGQSKTAEVGTRVLFLSSGNNVDPVRDMTRRTITITLDPVCETPAARDFKKQPLNEVRTDRGRFVSLALTIIRAWICAGKTKSECKTIATYNDWSEYCRQPLLWLGLSDPVQCIFEAMCEDPDRELLGEFLQAWHDRFGQTPTLVKDAICLIKSSDPLRELIEGIASDRAGNVDRRRLGWWIKRHSNRVVNGLRIVKDSSNSNSAKWKVESLK
ncbi:DNA-primase RepB domain-containing protein [Nitrosomonas sp.]|uniref:DNA-primase RepB domain-containing protein n=1 Tax=Nitrosomonas sp. TaxID=42353 RepID=UPI00207F0413|nr:DNA-primase RepB domain-containing protein [Nitrosomonas sp.]GJL73973.1 MAG: hypothetical protein NMNS02_00790 [Nitrosomonas sp.]